MGRLRGETAESGHVVRIRVRWAEGATRETIGDEVEAASLPDKLEGERQETFAKAAKAGVGDITEVLFEDSFKGFVISDQIKTRMTSQEMATLFSCPGKAQAFELDGSVAAFCVGERAGTALDET